MIFIKILSYLCLIFLLFALGMFYLRYVENRTIFYPYKILEYSPKELQLEFEEIFFKSANKALLHGWFIPAKDARYTVLFCHGNAGNISHRIEKLKFFYDLGCKVFIFDYQGYGKSKGRPSEKGLYLDVRGAYDYLLSRGIKSEAIIGYGESIGGAAIIDLAYKKKMAGIIIDSSFTSGKDMARLVYPFIPHWVFSSQFDSQEKIKSIDIPKLIIHSVNDEIVPFRLGKKLYDNAAAPKDFLQIRGGHNSSFFESQAILKDKIGNFLKKLK